MKKMVVTALMGIMIATAPISTEAKQIQNTRVAETQIQHKYHYRVEMLNLNKWTENKTWNKLLHRKGKKKYMVTKATGTVTNPKTKMGKDSCGYPISYKGISGIKKGSKITTYLIYCRSCNEPDHIIARYDVIVKK